MTQRMQKAQRPRGLRFFRTLSALVLREMSTTYGRSAIGYLWAVIEPVAGIVLMTVIMSIVIPAPPTGSSFALFYASGLLPFMMYLDISGKMASALRFSAPLLFYPGVTFVDALLARLILNGLTQTLVMFGIFVIIIMIEGLEVILNVPAMLLAIAMTLALATGIGTLNCFLLSLFPVWERMWAILNRPLMIISCVIFPLDAVPEPWRTYLWYNPLTHLAGQMRVGLYPTYDGSYLSPLYVFAVAGVTLVLGLVMLTRYRSYILNDG
jgi:capsular polysaccharide transport system permease protein